METCVSQASIVPNSDNADKARKGLAARNIPGLKVVIGAEDQLMIDYDDETIPERFQTGLSFLRQRVGLGNLDYSIYRSGSGKHWHAVVNMPIKMTELERVTWQAIFGSDFKRDALSTIGISRNVKNPILLFMFENTKPEETGSIVDKPARKFREE
jgi:hypothetical protein